VIAASGDAAALAAKSATSTIPIVFFSGGDPATMGLVTSLARLGGNLTGVAFMAAELVPKRLELLSEIGSSGQGDRPSGEPERSECRALHWRRAGSVAREGLAAPHPEGEQRKRDRRHFRSSNLHAGALVVSPNAFFASRRVQLVALAARHAVPAIYTGREFPAAGGLISYGSSLTAVFRQVGVYAGKILKGAAGRSAGRAAH